MATDKQTPHGDQKLGLYTGRNVHICALMKLFFGY